MSESGESRVNGYLFLLLKPIFPDNVGVWVRDASEIPVRIGATFPVPPDDHLIGGYWIMPIALFLGLGILLLNHRGTKKFLTWWRARRRPAL